MWLSRTFLAVITSALLLAGCGSTDESAEVGVTEPGSPTTGSGDPGTEDPADPDDPVVSVPTLPIGGGSYPLDGTPGVVCADVNWLSPVDDPSVPEGVSIRVTGYVVDPAVFEPVGEECDGASCLDGFVFTADSLGCQVALRSLVPWTDEQEGQDAVLRLSGEMTCLAEPCELDVDGDMTEVGVEAPEVESEPTESPGWTASTESTEPTEPAEPTEPTEPTESG